MHLTRQCTCKVLDNMEHFGLEDHASVFIIQFCQILRFPPAFALNQIINLAMHGKLGQCRKIDCNTSKANKC